MEKTSRDQFIESHFERVRTIAEESGEIVGRAVLALPTSKEDHVGMIISVGGFSVSTTSIRQNYYLRPSDHNDHMHGLSHAVGVVCGDTVDASRSTARPLASKEAIKKWAIEQEELLDIKKITPLQQVAICHSLIDLGVRPKRLPFAFVGGRFVTVDALKDILLSHSNVDVLMTHQEYRNEFSFREVDKLTTAYFTLELRSNVIVFSRIHGSDPFDQELRDTIIENGRHTLNDDDLRSIKFSFPFNYLIGLCEEAWTDYPAVSVERVELIASEAQAGSLQSWSLRFSKGG